MYAFSVSINRIQASSYQLYQLEFPTLTNIAYIEDASLRKTIAFQCLPELLGRLEDIFLGKHPRSPVHPKCSLALGILENMHSIMWVCVNTAHDESRSIGADGNQPKIKRASVLPNLFECRASRIVMPRAIVISAVWKQRYRPVASVSESFEMSH